MALPPPAAAPTTPTLTDEQQRAKLDAEHKAAVDWVERMVDTSLRGKQLGADGLIQLILPLRPASPEVFSDLAARYKAAGWSQAVVSADALVLKNGELVAKDPPAAAAHPTLYLVR